MTDSNIERETPLKNLPFPADVPHGVPHGVGSGLKLPLFGEKKKVKSWVHKRPISPSFASSILHPHILLYEPSRHILAD